MADMLQIARLRQLPVPDGPRPRVPHRYVCANASGPKEQAAVTPRRAAFIASLGLPALLGMSGPAQAAFLDLTDTRGTGAKESMESADQARDDNLDHRQRFSFQTTSKMSKDDHQQRAKESYGRLQTNVKAYLDKNLLNRVSNELGLQIGSLRYDLKQIAALSDKASRKSAQQQSKQAIAALEQLDLYARLGNTSAANAAYSDALAKLGTVVQSYG